MTSDDGATGAARHVIEADVIVVGIHPEPQSRVLDVSGRWAGRAAASAA